MSEEESQLVTALRALRNDATARSDTARLRDIFDEVEAALRSGVRQEALLGALNQNGFQMKTAGFKSALQRIRKERNAQSGAS